MCRENRIVVFLGAGFPIIWDAPKSSDLYELIKEKLVSTEYSRLIKLFPDSFEDVIAALYSYAVYPLSEFNQKLFDSKIHDKAIQNDAALLYKDCINKIMRRINDYERESCYSQYVEYNEGLYRLFKYLGSKYAHVSVYTTNYDEALPAILDWPESAMSLNGERFCYSPLAQHYLNHSYSNLHGSIHLEMKRFDGQQYEINHNSFFPPPPMLYSLENYGGNPSEVDLFTPIIVGHSKTQQIVSKHFNFALTCFANDLSDCDTFFSIGTSFSDPHLNAIVRQYTLSRNVEYVFVTLENNKVTDSIIERNVSSQIIGYNHTYRPDCEEDKVFTRENDRVVYYKHGVVNFLKDEQFQRAYL